MLKKTIRLLSLLLVVTSMHAEEKKTKIVVIGAGLAGLTTAYRLQEQGYDVEVYEATQPCGWKSIYRLSERLYW